MFRIRDCRSVASLDPAYTLSAFNSRANVEEAVERFAKSLG
jgi:hypothetical protein